jgi:FkbM family methyltransferase
MQLAPIAIFVYNRPKHTAKTLEALSKNRLADESIVYVFADGPKENAQVADLKKIEEVRAIIRQQNWCKELHVITREQNFGLAQNIVSGVSQVVNKHGNIIVLEDDIVTSEGFLQYMNDALTTYENEQRVMHISGYMFPLNARLPETFFYRQASCWGWATWKRAWQFYNGDAQQLISAAFQLPYFAEIDIDGTNQFVKQLEANITGDLKTWAVKWQFSVFNQDGLCLHPRISLVQNIGFDLSGENCDTDPRFSIPKLATSIKVVKKRVVSYPKIKSLFQQFYGLSGGIKPSDLLPPLLKEKLKIWFKPDYAAQLKETKKLAGVPRYVPLTVSFLSKQLHLVDIASYNFIKKELFEAEIYKFTTTNPKPYIIDCGANIGLSIIYFKQLYPEAEIVAFEPDKKVFEVLTKNMNAFGYNDVSLVPKGLWNAETTLRFLSEGADGGRVALKEDDSAIEIETVRLRPYLNRPVDLLKIDIEGAETKVLEDCSDLLINVQRLFVEYHSFTNAPQELDTLIGILSQSGFRLHISSPGLSSKTPFVTRNIYNRMDMQLNIYAFRE